MRRPSRPIFNLMTGSEDGKKPTKKPQLESVMRPVTPFSRIPAKRSPWPKYIFMGAMMIAIVSSMCGGRSSSIYSPGSSCFILWLIPLGIVAMGGVGFGIYKLAPTKSIESIEQSVAPVIENSFPKPKPRQSLSPERKPSLSRSACFSLGWSDSVQMCACVFQIQIWI